MAVDKLKTALANPRYAVDRVARGGLRSAMKRYYRYQLTGRRQWPPADGDAATEALEGASTVLFVCLGNICRSPFAAHLLGKELSQRATLDVDIRSTGLSTTPGRRSPDTAVAVAREFGVDLSAHRADLTERQDVEAADVVFLMDLDNYARFRCQFPRTDVPVYLLGALGPNPTVPIADPHGAGPQQFRDTYGRVATAVGTIAGTIEGRAAVTSLRT